MVFYLLKRVFMTVIVLFNVVVFLGLLVHIMPGDPGKGLLGPRATPESLARIRAEMDLDKPVPVQVANFAKNLLHGSLGTDVFSGRPVSEIIGKELPHTIILALSSLGLAVILGVPLGVYSATHLGSLLDRVTALFSVSLITIPSYVVALFLLLFFAVRLHALPAMGLGEEGDVLDYLRHLVLPVVALASGWIGYLARLVRASMLEVLSENYIRATMASGVSQRLVFYKYALKNALIPTVAILGLGLGGMMGGAVFAEMIFTRPGMGSLITQAIQQRNFPVVRASVLVVAVLFVGANLVADLAYTYLDPRIRLGEARG